MHAQLQLFKALEPMPGSDKNEWYTPARYIEAVRLALGGIDLDPASCELANQAVKASAIYTKEVDGLAYPWRGKVFMNCPYSPTPKPWIDKFLSEYRSGRITAGIILVPPKIDTAWFAPLFDGVICFVDHRIKFWGQPGSSNTFGSAFVYFGCNPMSFYVAFQGIGNVVQRMKT